MSKLRNISLLLLPAVAIFVVGTALPTAHAQTLASSASFSGSVADPSGARVANATVTLTNAEKGITRTFKTTDEGNFSFSLLPAGTYVLTVEAAGFQTFKQQQHSFTSQYGWSTGNVINVVTKSGGSSLHGSAYEYLRNGKLDANYFFNGINGTPKPNSHRNQFGVALGGPVYIPGVYKQRDKTFFFFNYEGHRENDPLTSDLNTVPIPAFRTGDFSALLGGNIGTDALCRPVLSGQVYDPFTTRQVTASCAVPNSNPAKAIAVDRKS